MEALEEYQKCTAHRNKFILFLISRYLLHDVYIVTLYYYIIVFNYIIALDLVQHGLHFNTAYF